MACSTVVSAGAAGGADTAGATGWGRTVAVGAAGGATVVGAEAVGVRRPAQYPTPSVVSPTTTAAIPMLHPFDQFMGTLARSGSSLDADDRQQDADGAADVDLDRGVSDQFLQPAAGDRPLPVDVAQQGVEDFRLLARRPPHPLGVEHRHQREDRSEEHT